MEKIYFDAEDISELLGVSKSKAYRIIRVMNAELGEEGYLVLAGKIPKKFFAERYYGLLG